jgi:peptidoglycan/LPS O-acetylase OafA/YrhL
MASAPADAPLLEGDVAALSEGQRRGAPRFDLAALDGVRGLASLFIVVGHFFTFWAPSAADGLLPVFGLE